MWCSPTSRVTCAIPGTGSNACYTTCAPSFLLAAGHRASPWSAAQGVGLRRPRVSSISDLRRGAPPVSAMARHRRTKTAVPVITRATAGAGFSCTRTLLPPAITTASSQTTPLTSDCLRSGQRGGLFNLVGRHSNRRASATGAPSASSGCSKAPSTGAKSLAGSPPKLGRPHNGSGRGAPCGRLDVERYILGADAV